MRFVARLLGSVWICLAGWQAEGAHTHPRLILGSDVARPGETVQAGVVLQMDSGWHTYWKNPGASGSATKIDWQLPAGVSVGEIKWPAPEKLPDEDLTTYIYNDKAVLMVSFKLAPDLKSGPINLKAKVSWLECKVLCVPGDAEIATPLAIGSEAKPSENAGLLEKSQEGLPKIGDSLGAKAAWEKPARGDTRPLVLTFNPPKPASGADFFPDASENFEVQGPTETLPADAAKPSEVRLRKQIKKLAGDWPSEISGLLVVGSGPERVTYEVRMPLGSNGSARASAIGSTSANSSIVAAPSLMQMLAYAFIGGLILNVMPCVLPVIALKILGFVGQAKEDRRKIRRLGLIYAAGVLVSFLVLAALVIGVRAAGHRAGWGMQFGSPQFLVAFTILVTLVALNLFGVFEVNLSGQVMGAAGNLASKHGAAGAFFNGILATVLATPCTAPFLSIALGFAFAPGQPAALLILLFLTIGLGLACPYVLLSWQPAWLKLLPKPGVWMENFKIAMGFPMLATAFWLLSLLPVHYGEKAWWVGIFLVFLALAMWVFGTFVQRGRTRRGLGALTAVALVACGYLFALEGQLRWRSVTAVEPASAGAIKNDPEGIAWQPWSPEALTSARSQGHPVLVDFTAKWCVTCNGIVRPALENPEVRQKISQLKAVPLLGDYTKFPPAITEELNRFHRAGVPLVLVYPGNPNEPAVVLPEPSPLRPASHYSRLVLDALNSATN